MKRRAISLLLTLVLALGLSAPAWGADAAPEDLRLSVEQALTAAQKLHAMGLFQGVGDNADGTPNFDLDRTPTRVEGVVMLVRLLGEDQEGAGGGWESPFADVPAWAASYVGYAYGRGYTKGTSDTAFSPMDPLDAAQYLTLVLRAMGYEDGADFQWDSPWTLSNQLGITDYDPASPDAFTRGTAAVWAWNAMSAQTSAGVRLADRLMAGGALTAEQAAAVGLAGGDALSVELVGPDLPANFTGYNSSGYLAYDITINSLSCRYHPRARPDAGIYRLRLHHQLSGARRQGDPAPFHRHRPERRGGKGEQLPPLPDAERHALWTYSRTWSCPGAASIPSPCPTEPRCEDRRRANARRRSCVIFCPSPRGPGAPPRAERPPSFLISQWIRKVRAARSRMMAPTRAISLRSRTTTVRRISPPSLNSRAMARPWASFRRVSGSRFT